MLTESVLRFSWNVTLQCSVCMYALHIIVTLIYNVFFHKTNILCVANTQTIMETDKQM